MSKKQSTGPKPSPLSLRREALEKHQVLDVSGAVGRIAEDCRPAIFDMVSEPGVPTETAIKILSNVGSKPVREQREIVKLYKSDDHDKVSLAKTRAVKAPPSPPAQLTRLSRVGFQIESEISSAPPAIKGFLQAAHSEVTKATDGLRAEYQKLKKEEASR